MVASVKQSAPTLLASSGRAISVQTIESERAAKPVKNPVKLCPSISPKLLICKPQELEARVGIEQRLRDSIHHRQPADYIALEEDAVIRTDFIEEYRCRPLEATVLSFSIRIFSRFVHRLKFAGWCPFWCPLISIFVLENFSRFCAQNKSE
jgi:hypothetical protein